LAGPRDSIITLLPGFLSADGLRALGKEADRLLASRGVRRDCELGGTPRHIWTVNQSIIREIGILIPELFIVSEPLRAFLSGIAGTDLRRYGDKNETCVILHLGRKGDCHGPHCDEFPYAFNVAVRTPGKRAKGGVLEFVPNCTDPAALATAHCQRVPFNPGDAYFMRTDNSVHQVTPLEHDRESRTVISLALSPVGVPDVPSTSTDAMFGDT
jgi:L-lysine 4-chlorinase